MDLRADFQTDYCGDFKFRNCYSTDEYTAIIRNGQVGIYYGCQAVLKKKSECDPEESFPLQKRGKPLKEITYFKLIALPVLIRLKVSAVALSQASPTVKRPAILLPFGLPINCKVTLSALVLLR